MSESQFSSSLIKQENSYATVKTTVTNQFVKNLYRDIINYYGRSMNVKGFRPGKIPPNLVIKRIGEEELIKLATREVKEQVMINAVRDLDLDIRKSGQVNWIIDPEAVDNAETEIEYTLEIPVFPEITIGKYTDIDVEHEKVIVTEEMRKNQDEKIFKRFVQPVIQPDSYEAKDSDYILVDWEGEFIDNPEDQSKFPYNEKGVFYQIGADNNVLPELANKLIGIKKDETRTFELVLPDDFVQKEIAGRTCRISAKVSSVSVMPEVKLDDEFVKTNLNIPSYEEFSKISNDLLERETERADRQLRYDKTIKKIMEDMQVEIPKDMVQAELDNDVTYLDRRLQEMGHNLMQYLEEAGKSLKEYREEREPKIIDRIKYMMIIKKLVKLESIGFSEREFQQFAIGWFIDREIPSDKVKDYLQHREVVDEITYDLLQYKVRSFLLARNNFVDKNGNKLDYTEPSPETLDDVQLAAPTDDEALLQAASSLAVNEAVNPENEEETQS